MKHPGKKIFSLMLIFCGIFSMLCCTSCRSTGEVGEGNQKPLLSEHNEDTLNAGMVMAENYMASFIAAVQQDDFSILSAKLPETSSKRLDRSKFADMQKWISTKLGRLDSGKYIDRFSQGALCSYIWKLSFVREKAENDAAVPERSVIEIAYSVNVMMVNGEPKIVKVGFIFW